MISSPASLLLGAVSCAIGFAQPGVPPLWGSLEAGPFAAGYRAYFGFDATRAYGKPRAPRPILINLWYPAVETKGEPARYREYMTPPALEGYSDFRSRLEGLQLDALSEDLFQKQRAALTPSERAHIEALLGRPTRAWRDAKPASGRFPIVLYHPGAGESYDRNSTICEYLASNGYVVVSSAFQPRDYRQAGSNDFDPDTSWADMNFLVTFARTLTNADLLNTGAFGHGAGAEYLLEWLGHRHPPLGAVVSLDATIEHDTPLADNALRKRISRLEPQTVPVLIAAPAEPAASFSVWDSYLPCHAEARGTYDRLARVLLAFFDANLKNQRDAWRRLLEEHRPDFRVSQRACGGPA